MSLAAIRRSPALAAVLSALSALFALALLLAVRTRVVS